VIFQHGGGGPILEKNNVISPMSGDHVNLNILVYFLSRSDIYSLRCQGVTHETLCKFLGMTHTQQAWLVEPLFYKLKGHWFDSQ
jgi:hypothetical protein